MSVSGEALDKEFDKLRAAKDLWLEQHVDYKVRSERMQKTVDRAEENATRGAEATAPQRKALREKLRKLRERAVGFADVATKGDYEALRAQIELASGHLDLLRWAEADQAIDQADRMITAGRERLEAVVRLTQRCDGLAVALGRMGTAEDLDVIAPLIDRLPAIRKLLALPQLDPVAALQALTQLESDAEAGRVLIASRRDAVQQAYAERRLLLADLTELQQRARQAQADEPLLKALAEPLAMLHSLLGSLDKEALELANKAVADELPKLRPRVEAVEAAKDLRDRVALLPGLRQQYEQLAKAYAGDKAGAHPVYVRQFEELEARIEPMLADEKLADVGGIQDLLAELQKQQDYVVDEMPGIGRERKRMRKALDAYDEWLADEPESNAWGDLSYAHAQLPKAITARKEPAFGNSPAWTAEGGDDNAAISDFLRWYIVVDAQQAGAEQREAYETAQEERTELRDLLKPLRRHAKPAQLQAITLLFTQLKAWLDDDDIDRLDDTQQGDVQLKLDDIRQKLKDLEKERDDARDGAVLKDSKDGGHSVARHGPDIPDDKLKRRLTSGKAPDGVFSPTRKSSRFINFREWEATRDAAFAEAESLYGLDFGPKRDKHTAHAPMTFTMDHGRTVGEGFEGTGTGTFKAHPSGNGGGTVYSVFVPLPPLTATKSTIEWNGKNWVASQHFPTD